MRIEVRYISHSGDEALISRVAGTSRDSRSGPSVEDLLEWEHFSPLEFASMTFFISCPIYVARQIMRHRTGKYMERSLRYTASTATPYVPHFVSGDEKLNGELTDVVYRFYLMAQDTYDHLVSSGVSKEQARGVLPMASLTQFYMQMDLRNLINFFLLRTSPDAQSETAFVAWQMLLVTEDYFPSVGKYVRDLIKEKTQ